MIHLEFETDRQENETNYGEADKFKIWEVARAAMAERLLFEPLKTIIPGIRKSACFEAAPLANPIRIAVSELEDQHGNDDFAAVVSVGAGRKLAEAKTKPIFYNKGIFPAFSSNLDDPDYEHQNLRFKLRESKTNFPYYRLHDRERVIREPYYLTTDELEMAFEVWASSMKVADELRQCAATLVRCRRARTMNIDKWERFATAARFDCRDTRCNITDMLSRQQFREHLQREHPDRPNSQGQEERRCRRTWASQKHSTGPSDTMTRPSSSEFEGKEASQQKSPLKQSTNTPHQDGAIDSLTATLDRTSIDSFRSNSNIDSTAADNFVRDPQSFYNTMHNLQSQVFKIGRGCIGSIVWEDAGHSLALPEVPSDSSKSVPNLLQDLNLHLERNSKFLQAVVQGLYFLNCVEFCKPVYNIIVQDADRDDVLRVVPIDSSTLFTLHSLVKEASSKCILSQWETFQQILSYIREAVDVILDHLNLPTSSHFDISWP